VPKFGSVARMPGFGGATELDAARVASTTEDHDDELSGLCQRRIELTQPTGLNAIIRADARKE
jgi:hypothetical protein